VLGNSQQCRIKYNGGEVGEVAKELYEALTNIQMGQAEDKMGWIVELN
jgi:branched-subunit amino acid aminotransferase/4-amino-4-deoxychorismate lyase